MSPLHGKRYQLTTAAPSTNTNAGTTRPCSLAPHCRHFARCSDGSPGQCALFPPSCKITAAWQRVVPSVFVNAVQQDFPCTQILHCARQFHCIDVTALSAPTDGALPPAVLLTVRARAARSDGRPRRCSRILNVHPSGIDGYHNSLGAVRLSRSLHPQYGQLSPY